MLTRLQRQWLLWSLSGVVLAVAVALASGIPIGGGNRTMLPVWPRWAVCMGELIRSDQHCPVRHVEIFADAQGRPKVSLNVKHAIVTAVSDPDRKLNFTMRPLGLRIDMPAGWLAYRFPSNLRLDPANSFETLFLYFALEPGDRPVLKARAVDPSEAVIVRFGPSTPYLRSDWDLRRRKNDPRLFLERSTIAGLNLWILGPAFDRRPMTLDDARRGSSAVYFVPMDTHERAPDGSRSTMYCARNTGLVRPTCTWTFVVPNDRLAESVRQRIPPNSFPLTRNNDWQGYGVRLTFPRSAIERWRDIVDTAVCMVELVADDISWDETTRSRHRCESAADRIATAR